MTNKRKILIIGESHISHKLRDLASDRFEIVDSVQDDVAAAFIVHHEDNHNVKFSLSVRREHATVPIYAILYQDTLGDKIAASMDNFHYVDPSNIAAKRFVEAALKDLDKDTKRIKIKLDTKSFKPDTLTKKAVMFILAVVASCTLYFHLFEGMPFVDALYFTVTIWSTVGFGDFSMKEYDDSTKLIGCCFMILSVTGTAMMFALVSDTIVRKRKQLSRGKSFYSGKNHIIVVGCGTVGSQVVFQLLKHGEKPVMLGETMETGLAEDVLQTGTPFIVGDAKDKKNLIRAGLGRCKAIIVVTQFDLTNLEVGLDAKALKPDVRVVLRIYEQCLANDIKSLGINTSLSMSDIAAKKLLDMFSNDTSK